MTWPWGKTETIDAVEAKHPCCYRSQRQSIGHEQGKTKASAAFYRCGNPGVVPELCVVDRTFTDSGPDVDAWHQVDGQTRQLLVGNCLACPRRTTVPVPRIWEPGELRFIRYVELAADTLKLLPQLPPNISGVAGIPRSGMLPAFILATSLNVPLYSLHKDEGLRAVGAGSREKILTPGGGKLLVVDDCVYMGTAIRWARQQLKGFEATFAAVYTRRPKLTELAAVALPSPHIFEWNVFNNHVLAGGSADKRLRGGFAFDFDGVLCENPVAPYDPKRWIPVAKPTPWIPRGVEVPLVISFRLERWRKMTEKWLDRQGVKVRKMILHPARTERERDSKLDVAGHKGAAFRDSACSVMFESEPHQAAVIAQVAGKPVIVPRTGEVFLP